MLSRACRAGTAILGRSTLKTITPTHSDSTQSRRHRPPMKTEPIHEPGWGMDQEDMEDEQNSLNGTLHTHANNFNAPCK